MEGYDVECFDDHLSNDLYCIICLKLMRNAIQMRCGHGMCKSCFNGLVHSCELRNTELNCPSCRKSVVVDEIVNVPMIDRVITSLKVKCSNNKQGCQWIGKLETLESHFKKCDYAPIQCPNEMCNDNVLRYQMEEHLKSCLYGTIDCIYCDFGCDEKVMRNDMDTHIKSSPLKHLEMMSGNIQEKDKIIETLRKENDHLQNQLHGMKQQNLEMTEFKNQLSKANTELKDMISKFPEYHVSVNALNEELKATRAKFDELNIGQAFGAKHNDDKEKGTSVSVETESSQCIDDNEVLDSLKFIVFRDGLLTHSDILDQALEQFELEYDDAEMQWKIQIKISMKGASENIKTNMKFSNGYWHNILHALKDKFKILHGQQIYQIVLLCKQLQYLQDNTIENFPANTTSICIGKFRYGKEKCGQLKPTTNIFTFGDHKLYVNANGKLCVHSNSAKAVKICHQKCLRTVSAKKVNDVTFVFQISIDKLYQANFISIIGNKLLLKIQEL